MKLPNFFKQVVFLCFALLIFLQGVSAQDANPAAAKALIESTTQQVLDAIKGNPDHAFDVAQEYVLPHFDFIAMSRLVIGKNWKSATTDQKKQFVQAFRDLLIRTYANTLIEAAKSDVNVEYLPIRAKEGAKRIRVQSLVQFKGKTIKLDYSLRIKKGEWKVWDVSAGGVSLVTNYRAEFQTIHKEKGMDGLIETVNDKNQS